MTIKGSQQVKSGCTFSLVSISFEMIAFKKKVTDKFIIHCYTETSKYLN